MTRQSDDKAGGQDSGNSHNDKVERRFTKEAKAKTGQDGKIRDDRMGREHRDNTGGNGYPDVGHV